jgi:hypothetical protein
MSNALEQTRPATLLTIGARFTFSAQLCLAFFGVLVLTVSLVSAEMHVTNNHPLANAEITNGCAPCGASMALALLR